MKEIKLGESVKCIVTGFKGIVTSKIDFINGCTQYLIKPKVTKGKDNEMPKGQWIDDQNLEVTGVGVSKKNRPVSIEVVERSREIELGVEAKDIISEFKGTITAKSITMSGEVQYCLRPKVKKKEEEKMPEGQWISIEEIEVIGENKKAKKIKRKPTGGPQTDAPTMNKMG